MLMFDWVTDQYAAQTDMSYYYLFEWYISPDHIYLHNNTKHEWEIPFVKKKLICSGYKSNFSSYLQ